MNDRNPNLPRATPLVLVTTLACFSATAQDEDAELAALMELLEQETEIATHTKLNADFVPGVVTVLQGEDMRALGARTVHDALALVPGVEIYRDDLGNASLRPRGVDFAENSGQVQLLVNGLDFFRQASGVNNGILLLPIEQVERIEVIRGPGSGVHGDFAFTGLVNIVTRRELDQVYLAAGSGGLVTGGAQLSLGNSDEEFHLDVGVSTWQADDLDSAVNAPFVDEDRSFAHLVGRWRGFEFKLAAIDREALQPGAMDRRRPLVDEGYTLSLSHSWERPEHDQSIRLWLHHGDSEVNSGALQFFEGGRTELGIEASKRVGRHRLLSELSVGERDTVGLTIPPNLPGPGPGPGPGPNPGPPPVRPPIGIDLEQDTRSLLIQDEIDLDPVMLTVGARYDDLEDFDSRVSPRLAAVWQIDDRHTLKTQYSEGFRSATAFEETVTRNAEEPGDLDYEVITLAEIQYLYRTPATRLRMAVYDGQVEDLIRPGLLPPGVGPDGAGRPFINLGEIELSGVELEWSWHLSPRWWITANGSLIDTEVNAPQRLSDGRASFGQADYLANLATIWHPHDNWTLGAHYNRVGDRESSEGEIVDGYDRVNFSATWRPAAVDGLSIRALVRNAFEGDVTYLQFRPPNVVRELSFDDRQYSLEVTWTW